MATSQMRVNNRTINNHIIHNMTDGGIAFQSYDSMIAKYEPTTGRLLVTPSWEYSKTTMKYFKEFVNQYTPYAYNSKAAWETETDNNNKIIGVDFITMN